MNNSVRITFLSIIAIVYIISIVYLDDVKVIGGNVTPVINLTALSALTLMGVLLGFFLVKASPASMRFLSGANIQKIDATQRHKRLLWLLIIVLILFKLFAFILTPRYIQIMHIWPDSIGYLADLHTVLKEPMRILDRKSPTYVLWLLLNNQTLGWFINPQHTETYFGATVYLKDYIPPLVLQNILGIFSALICFSIFVRTGIGMAFAVTLLTFINPTTLAIESTILRESLALFFILCGIAMILKALREKSKALIVASGFIFILSYHTRPELLMIYIVISISLFAQAYFNPPRKWSFPVLFCLPFISYILFAGYMTSEQYLNTTYGGKFVEALHGLKSKCYFYSSPNYPELVTNIQKRAIQCEKERFGPCDAPAASMFTLKMYLDEEFINYNQTLSKAGKSAITLDNLFLDVVANNTPCYISSVLTNIGFNISHHLQNIVPIFYGKKNYWISENFNYYISPKMMVLYEKDRNYFDSKLSHKSIILFFRLIELHLTRKILLPFFFIGSWIILFSNKRNYFDSESNALLWTVVLMLSWVHLAFLSIMVDPVARFIYPILPFLFAVEVVGVLGVYYFLKDTFLNIIDQKNN